MTPRDRAAPGPPVSVGGGGPDDALGLPHGTLSLSPPDPRWPALFAAEAGAIRAALAAGNLPDDPTIDHIGSTAVPGLAAKPILDISLLAPLSDATVIAATLSRLGYVDRGQRGGHLFIRTRGPDVRTHNLHLYAPGDADRARHIAFRDRLRDDPALRDAYARLKAGIIAAQAGRRAGYAEAKGPFIAAVLAGETPA